MAKDVFYRTKPHLNGGGMIQHKQLGFSALGVQQITHHQVITDPHDRGLVAEILGEGRIDPKSRSEIKYYTITLTNAHVVPEQGWGRWEVNPRAIPYLDAAAMIQLEQLGFSAVGIHQIATGQIVTDPQDRGLVAEMLHELILQLAPPMKIGWMRAYCEGTDLRKS
jgi:hypothetical protein